MLKVVKWISEVVVLGAIGAIALLTYLIMLEKLGI